jgi:hypothetical protein
MDCCPGLWLRIGKANGCWASAELLNNNAARPAQRGILIGADSRKTKKATAGSTSTRPSVAFRGFTLLAALLQDAKEYRLYPPNCTAMSANLRFRKENAPA